MEINGTRGPFFVMKSWHTALTLISWLVMTVVQFVYVYAQTQHNTADIEQMKREHVTKDRYEEAQQDILRRLQRIEDKLDRTTKN